MGHDHPLFRAMALLPSVTSEHQAIYTQYASSLCSYGATYVLL